MSDFESLLAPTTTSSDSFADLATSTTTSGASGGPDGEYDGGAKRAHLFYFSSTLARSGAVCLGFVGSGNRRFCIKKAGTCTAKSHAVKFDPVPGTFFLKGNDSCAHTQPNLPASLVPPAELAVIQASKHTVDEWTGIFARYGDANSEGEGLIPADLFNKVPLKTPAKPAAGTSIEADLMIYSPKGLRHILANATDNDDWFESDQTILPRDIATFLKHVNSFLVDFEHWWKTPLADNYSTISTIKEDLHTLKQNCEHIHLMLGQPTTIHGNDFLTLWSAIEFISSNKNTSGVPDVSSTATAEIHELKTIVDAIPTVLNQYVLMEDLQNLLDSLDLNGMQDSLKKWEQRFVVISAGLHQVKTLIADVNQIQHRLNSQHPTGAKSHPLLQRLNSSRPPSPAFGPAMEPGADIIARLNTAENKLIQLENRVVGDGVTIGSFTFQSLDDVRLWCRQHLPTHRFGLFLDGVSIFEFLAQDHTDSTEVLTNLYNAQKNQFTNLYDSKVITSCQNLFPSIFGRSSSDGMDTSRTLPGLSTADKWDNNGVTGLRFQIA